MTLRFASTQGSARGLPSVFDVSKKPWIDVNGAAVDAIIEQVKRCPSAALSYEQLKKAE
ncbi:MAG: (4Fe-4S)-binding protein [Bryobacteraceae bacterium]